MLHVGKVSEVVIFQVEALVFHHL